MTYKKEIGAGQLFGLLLLSRFSVALTFPFDFAGSFNNQEWLVSLLFFPFLLLLLLPSYFLYKKTGLSPLQAAYGVSPLAGGGTAVLLCFFFLLSTAVNLSRFNIFMTSTTGADQSPLFFPLLLIIPSFYAAHKGLEAISRTALIALVIGFISVAVIILAVFSKFDLLNIVSPRFYDKKGIAELLGVYVSNTSEAVAFSLLLPRVRGNIKRTMIGFSALCCIGMFIIFFSVSAVFGELTAFENFPFYALADIAELGELKRLSALHASTWILGLFIKCALFLYLASDCIKGLIKGRLSTVIAAAGGVLTLTAGTLISRDYPSSKSRVYSGILFCFVIVLALVIPSLFAFLTPKKTTVRKDEKN